MTSSVTDAAVEAAIAENTKIYLEGLAERVEALTPPPASELVTVAKLGGINGVSMLHHIECMTKAAQAEYGKDLVTREQAEAREADLLRQLAAKDERIAELEHDNDIDASTMVQAIRRFEAAEAKLAAQGQMIPRNENCGRYLAEGNDGRLFYLNHADTWQECPNFIAAPQSDRSAVLEEAANVARKYWQSEQGAFDPDGDGLVSAIRAIKEQP